MNKLDIGDVDIHILKHKGFQELCISFKTAYINIFNLIVLDMKREKNAILYRMENFQLWETKISSVLLDNNDFVVMNKEGVFVYALGMIEKRPVYDHMGNGRMIHSLASCSYLQLARENFLVYACQKYAEREIQVMQEYTAG
jgi:hypothetical protein